MSGKTKGESELSKLRDTIDSIDRQIAQLLERRAGVAKQIYKVKREHNLDVFDPTREAQKLAELEKLFKNFPSKSALRVFKEIFSGTRSIAKKIKVAYLGPEGSFSFQASREIFGSDPDFVPKHSIADVFDEVVNLRVDYGVVPIDNSRDGLVGETLDLLVETDAKIIYEVEMRVSFSLFSRYPLSRIKKIYSHPKAFSQCIGWIRQNLPDAKLIPTSSTSEAVRIVAESDEPYAGAIGSRTAGEIFRINEVARDIQDYPTFTSFVVISPRLSGEGERTSLCFSVQDRPGALYLALKPFAKRRINLKKIHSRPDKITLRYNFFVELEGKFSDRKIKSAIRELEKVSTFVKVFGSYPVVRVE